MDRLHAAYRAIHTQAFVPIFTTEGTAIERKLEACIEAGLTAVEYTLRNPDAIEAIGWIRRRYPDLFLLAGSTLDDDATVARMKPKHRQLRTLVELADLGVDGFVSMSSFADASIRQWASTHVVIPSAMTVGEAFVQLAAGAAFIKLHGRDVELLERLSTTPLHGACPIFVTGGMNLDRIPETMKRGAHVVASGFDVVFPDPVTDETKPRLVATLAAYRDLAREARNARCPAIAEAENADWDAWATALPHVTPVLWDAPAGDAANPVRQIPS